MVQWLRLWASIAGGVGSIPGYGAQIPQPPAVQSKEIKLNKKFF